jgi:hypothetical protein
VDKSQSKRQSIVNASFAYFCFLQPICTFCFRYCDPILYGRTIRKMCFTMRTSALIFTFDNPSDCSLFKPHVYDKKCSYRQKRPKKTADLYKETLNKSTLLFTFTPTLPFVFHKFFIPFSHSYLVYNFR